MYNIDERLIDLFKNNKMLECFGNQEKGESNMLTDNQKALLRRLAHNTHSLELCTGGYALWDRNISWSQGRTPNNAITETDISNLTELGYLVDAGFGGLKLNLKRFDECYSFEDIKWNPANEGYTGVSFEQYTNKR